MRWCGPPGCQRRSPRGCSSCCPSRKRYSPARTDSGGMRGGWCAGSRTFYASGRGSRDNADFGMRIGKGSSGWRLDLSFTFRTPHSAFRILLFAMLASRAEAQVDPSGSWRTLHTPHFRIHFRPTYRDAALTQAREAERSYELLATELHPPRGVVDITLADDIDAANGFTTVFPSNRITIYAAPPAGDHGRADTRVPP